MIEPQAAGVLAYLEWAEDREINPHFRCDLRIAWVTVLRAVQGMAEPHVSATCEVLGVHPNKVWARIEAMRRAKCGPLYNAVFPETNVPAEWVSIPDYDPTCGRIPYEGRFFDLADTSRPEDDTGTTGAAHGDHAPADRRLGIWPDADDCHTAADRTGIRSEPSLSAASGRKPPQSVRSAAQKWGKLADASYSGA